ncbi:uncharacterized protein LOC113851295 [Abrus precatorius]|uniref:Uncharacterized protein LOC113851295 n=1 Tax=Abrus precatorius TaxID=3816 RepID=A0A8B8K1N7_ABRPR|nr:uncharacterized protein LOC113851295 [Abrus precatorius]
MACNFPDVFYWIQNLPPISEWETSSMSLNVCSSTPSQPCLDITLSKSHHSTKLSFVIISDFNTPIHLWTSKPWKFEESVYGYSANLNWFLHDSMDGKEVFSSKPSKFALLNPKSWFKNRYSSAYRPFTRQGGVIFAGDEYGESVWWKVDKGAIGKTMEWEIRGWIWLTYWPNKHITFYNETRRLEFREIVHLNVA